MHIYYASMTGNVRRFAAKLDRPAVEIRPNIGAEGPFILITYTIGFGEVPAKVADFLRSNGGLLRGVAVSGNRNWGANYGKAGDTIAREFGVPLLHKFELAGNAEDVRIFNERVDDICDISY